MERSNLSYQPFEQGKLPPQAISLEEKVLGGIMSEKHVHTLISDLLMPEVFYKEIHQIIYTAIEILANESKGLSYTMVIQQLKKTGDLEIVGGPYYVTQLTESIAYEHEIKEYCLIIKEKYMAREIIRMCSSLISDAYEDTVDVFESLDKAQNILSDVVLSNMSSSEATTTVLFQELHSHIDKAISLREQDMLSGVPCMLSDLNKATGGWQESDMIVVASRPSMGKTAFTKSLIEGVVKIQKEPVLMFSLEMTRLQLTARIASEVANISSQDILAGKCIDVMDKISEAPGPYYDGQRELLIIDDTPALSINDLRSRTKRIMAIHKPKLIIIDYLQLMRGSNKKGQTREQEISEISRGVKILAKELKIPIIALAQLSREVERRNQKRPKLADLRESGSIEQDSDVVLFLYRPWYYYKHDKDDSYNEATVRNETVSTEYLAEIIIAKHRNGPTKSIPVKFTDYLTKFEDWPVQFKEPDMNVKSPVKEENDIDTPF